MKSPSNGNLPSRRSLAAIAAIAATSSLAALVSAPSAARAASNGGVAGVAVRGADDGLWVNRGFGWENRGGRLIGAPALAYANGSTLYVATGTDHQLWIRSDEAGWRPLSSTGTYCNDNPAVDVTGTTFTVACKGGDASLWYGQTALGGSGIPQLGAFQSLGGGLGDGPALTTVGGVLTFAVTGIDRQHVWMRTQATAYAGTPWFCNGHPALASSGTAAYFACDGTDGQLWYSQNLGGGWSGARPGGGRLLGGVGMVAGPAGADIYVEGVDAAAWHSWLPAGGSTGGFNGYGGRIAAGSGAGAGSASPNAPAFSLSHQNLNGVDAEVVTADLTRIRVVTDTADSGDCANNCRVQSVQQFEGQNGGFAAINGTYFCPYPATCAGKFNSFDGPVYNTRLGRWINPYHLSDGHRGMITFNGAAHSMYAFNNQYPGAPVTAGISMIPDLLVNGQNVVGNYRYDAHEASVGVRSGIGVRGNTVFLVIARNATTNSLAGFFQALGCSDALHLDGGGSAAMTFNGGYVFGPGRNVPNAVILATR